MIRRGSFRNGEQLWLVEADLDARTISRWERGTLVDGPRPMTDAEVVEYTPEPDPRESALAKLQALGLTEAEALALIGG